MKLYTGILGQVASTVFPAPLIMACLLITERRIPRLGFHTQFTCKQTSPSLKIETEAIKLKKR